MFYDAMKSNIRGKRQNNCMLKTLLLLILHYYTEYCCTLTKCEKEIKVLFCNMSPQHKVYEKVDIDILCTFAKYLKYRSTSL